MPATTWLRAPQNDLSVQAFFDNWQLAVSAREPNQRETALVRSLLALGGVLSVLQDMGQPAFVRNDFRGEFPDAGSDFETFVADRYGSVALPRAAAAVTRPDLESFFVAADNRGLAQATQRQFFSPGTLPRDFTCVSGDTPAAAAGLVNQSLRFVEPKLDSLDLRPSERTRYVVRAGTKIAAYRRVADKVHFFLDHAVYADVARDWLPQVMAYAAGLADYLLRGKVEISLSEEVATLTVSGLRGNPDGDATVHVFLEEEGGVRRELAVAPLRGGLSATVPLPKGTHKVAASVRGRDSAGIFVATGELTLP
jgi:hypothetical protein